MVSGILPFFKKKLKNWCKDGLWFVVTKKSGNLATGDLAWVMWQAVVWWPTKLAEGGGGLQLTDTWRQRRGGSLRIASILL